MVQLFFCVSLMATVYALLCNTVKARRQQGLPCHCLHTVFQAIMVSRLVYALTAWVPFVTHEKFNRFHRYEFVNSLGEFQSVLD